MNAENERGLAFCLIGPCAALGIVFMSFGLRWVDLHRATEAYKDTGANLEDKGAACLPFGGTLPLGRTRRPSGGHHSSTHESRTAHDRPTGPPLDAETPMAEFRPPPGRQAYEAQMRCVAAIHRALEDACGGRNIDFAGARDRELAGLVRTKRSALWMLRERRGDEGFAE